MERYLNICLQVSTLLSKPNIYLLGYKVENASFFASEFCFYKNCLEGVGLVSCLIALLSSFELLLLHTKFCSPPFKMIFRGYFSDLRAHKFVNYFNCSI